MAAPAASASSSPSSTDLFPSLTQCAILSTAFKILLFPAYKSTDFEVHRNWLAITHSLPLREWYTDTTSPWTLDYPPFFAWFEYVLSRVASLLFGRDAPMLDVKNLDYAGWDVIAFQRGSVIVSEFLLLCALKKFVDAHRSSGVTAQPKNCGISAHQAQAIALSILFSPALLLLDHIHFQYNGFLSGLFVLSLVYAQRQDSLLRCGATFAALLCFKHIYLYVALAYFVYLGRAYCLDPERNYASRVFGWVPRVRVGNIVRLGCVVVGVFGVAGAPFVYLGQSGQVLGRLFPFARGLCHAYWAPNVWALYTFLDRVLIYIAPRLGLAVPLKPEALGTSTRGLVGDTTFAILPTINPQHTILLTILFQALPLLKLLAHPSYPTFLGATTLSAYASFLFGWHVHEKAVLHVLLPMSLLALRDRRYLAAFHPLAVAAHIGLFPLLYGAQETPLKIVYTMAWLVVFLVVFGRLASAPRQRRVFFLDRGCLVYDVVAMGVVVVYACLVHGKGAGEGGYPFLPLMMVSVTAGVGVVGSWIGFMVVYFRDGDD